MTAVADVCSRLMLKMGSLSGLRLMMAKSLNLEPARVGVLIARGSMPQIVSNFP